MGIKRNCSAEFTVEIEKDPSEISKVEIVFKKQPDPKAPELLKLEYTGNDFESFIEAPDNNVRTRIVCKLKPSQTYQLTAGTVFMDIRPVLSDGYVVPLDMMAIDDVGETLFDEVYDDD